MDVQRVILVGNKEVGKKCLLCCLKGDGYPTEYIPAVVENFGIEREINGENILLCLWDAAGLEVFDGIRSITFKTAENVLFCYAVDDRASFNEVKRKWAPEMRFYAPNAAFFVIGMKIDIRDKVVHAECDANYVKYNEGKLLATEIGAISFSEVSSKENINVDEIIMEICKHIYKIKKRNWSKYCCMT